MNEGEDVGTVCTECSYNCEASEVAWKDSSKTDWTVDWATPAHHGEQCIAKYQNNKIFTITDHINRSVKLTYKSMQNLWILWLCNLWEPV